MLRIRSTAVYLLSAFSLIECDLNMTFSERSFDSDCGQVFTKSRFIIESPQYPSNYPTNLQCSYLVKGPTCPTYFSVQFLDFNLEESVGCTKDRLEIDDQDALCGNRRGKKTYFSQEGALIFRLISDRDNTARGYRLLISRTCGSNNPNEESDNSDITTKKAESFPNNWYTTKKDVEYTTASVIDTRQEKCCKNLYNSKQFILTSPNFPSSSSKPINCIYQIHKANNNVCRLRIHVKFFWLGRRSDNCFEDYLQIDGKFICGCKDDLKLISPFQNNSPKILRFVSKGDVKNSYSGFVMEIIQDECPKRYTPESPEQENNATFHEKFHFYNDQINRVSWPKNDSGATIEKLQLISEHTEVIPDGKSDSNSDRGPKLIKHIYFFTDDGYNTIPRDREETTYVDTSTMVTDILPDLHQYDQCLIWNRNQIQSFSFRNLEICRGNEGSTTTAAKKCVDLNFSRGYFKSPGYPFFYPPNLNLCYRVNKMPGFCAVRIHIKDFHLEESPNCEKDFLLFENKSRYCKGSLMNAISTFDLTNKGYEEISFVTDAFYCGRGFFVTYEQIQCQEMTYPSNPVTPSLPPSYNPYNPMPQPAVPCHQIIQDRIFTFAVYDYNEPVCSFIIKKYTENVCSVKLYFEEFNLVCAVEGFVANNMMYCGHLSGKSVTFDLRDRDTVLTYRKTPSQNVRGTRLRIRGIQSIEDCSYPDVPAERLVEPVISRTSDFTEPSKYILKLIDKESKNICGIISNRTETKLPSTVCDLIESVDANVTKCIPLKENSLFVPVNLHKIELKVRHVEKSEEIEFEEVDCNKVADMMNI